MRRRSNVKSTGGRRRQSVEEQKSRRNVISSVFVSVLIGIAFQEMVGPVRDSVRASGITPGTAILFSIFFLTSMRFFIGNQLHLISDRLVRMRGGIWFYDLFWIIMQTTVLIFLGGVSSVESSRAAKVNFADLLIVLYGFDVIWITSQWVLGKLFSGWRRHGIPWSWAILNTVLIIAILLVRYFTGDVHSTTGLALLGIFSGIAFVVDVLLSDHYDVI